MVTLSLHPPGEWVPLAALPAHPVFQAAHRLAQISEGKCQFVLPGSRGQQHTPAAGVQPPECVSSAGKKCQPQSHFQIKEGQFKVTKVNVWICPFEHSGLSSLRWMKRSLNCHLCPSPSHPPALTCSSFPLRSLIIWKCSVTGPNECYGTCRGWTGARKAEPPPPALRHTVNHDTAHKVQLDKWKNLAYLKVRCVSSWSPEDLHWFLFTMILCKVFIYFLRKVLWLVAFMTVYIHSASSSAEKRCSTIYFFNTFLTYLEAIYILLCIWQHSPRCRHLCFYLCTVL